MYSESDILRAAEILRTGGLVAFPTETVYGLGANALDERAVAKIFEAKGRPRFDPLIVHIADRSWLSRLVADWSLQAERLADRFWPGPLTLVLPKTEIVPDLVTSGCDTVAVRMPDHPVAQTLLRAADVPVAAPSANPFGRISPTTAGHVRDQLGDRIDLILDGGPCRVGVESSVLQLGPSGATLLRPGGVTVEEIEELIGPLQIGGVTPLDHANSSPGESEVHSRPGLVSPGNLASHYAPRTPLMLWDRRRPESEAAVQQALASAQSSRVGLLAFRPPDSVSAYAVIEVLSNTGDLQEAAARFFAALRRLDAAGVDLIIADLFPEVGLGRALNDRLRRAAHA
ncbi:MAG: threonylcarbamoyl-AMP synthase [Planctomycetes bacterium]|nr:threonylcarbamoyl-AMP synthase [Planctomycetota bacterium]